MDYGVLEPDDWRDLQAADLSEAFASVEERKRFFQDCHAARLDPSGSNWLTDFIAVLVGPRDRSLILARYPNGSYFHVWIRPEHFAGDTMNAWAALKVVASDYGRIEQLHPEG